MHAPGTMATAYFQKEAGWVLGEGSLGHLADLTHTTLQVSAVPLRDITGRPNVKIIMSYLSEIFDKEQRAADGTLDIHSGDIFIYLLPKFAKDKGCQVCLASVLAGRACEAAQLTCGDFGLESIKLKCAFTQTFSFSVPHKLLSFFNVPMGHLSSHSHILVHTVRCEAMWNAEHTIFELFS